MFFAKQQFFENFYLLFQYYKMFKIIRCISKNFEYSTIRQSFRKV